jgi:hypothetical protein
MWFGTNAWCFYTGFFCFTMWAARYIENTLLSQPSYEKKQYYFMTAGIFIFFPTISSHNPKLKVMPAPPTQLIIVTPSSD